MNLPLGLDGILVACLSLFLIGELRRALWHAVIAERRR